MELGYKRCLTCTLHKRSTEWAGNIIYSVLWGAFEAAKDGLVSGDGRSVRACLLSSAFQ